MEKVKVFLFFLLFSFWLVFSIWSFVDLTDRTSYGRQEAFRACQELKYGVKVPEGTFATFFHWTNCRIDSVEMFNESGGKDGLVYVSLDCGQGKYKSYGPVLICDGLEKLSQKFIYNKKMTVKLALVLSDVSYKVLYRKIVNVDYCAS